MIEGLTPAFKRNNILQIRLTTPELETVKKKIIEMGFGTYSDFFRYIVLNYSNTIESKINQTNANVKEILKIIIK